MKKNGFIATSLMYSFFLVFLTLFLTIIAEGLQQKLLLNEIEKGIKTELNSTMGIKDFQVGDMINISKEGDSTEYSDWVIANVDYENKKLILYSFDFTGTYPNTCFVPMSNRNLTLNDLKNDIDSGYMNHTYFNKIIYTFNKSQYSNYMIEEDSDATNNTNDKFVETSIKNIKNNDYKTCIKVEHPSCTKGTEGCICNTIDGTESCTKRTETSCTPSATEECSSCTMENDASIILDNPPFENTNNYIVTGNDITNINQSYRKRIVVNLENKKLNYKLTSGNGIIMLSC